MRLIDAEIKIEGSLDSDIDDIAGQAVVTWSGVPIIVIRADRVPKPTNSSEMESRWDLEAKTFELAVPVRRKEDIQALEDAAKAFHQAHHDATVIPHLSAKSPKPCSGPDLRRAALYDSDSEETTHYRLTRPSINCSSEE